MYYNSESTRNCDFLFETDMVKSLLRPISHKFLENPGLSSSAIACCAVYKTPLLSEMFS